MQIAFSPRNMRPLDIRDLQILALIVVVHFAVVWVLVSLRDYNVIALAFALPVPLMAILQKRFKLSWPIASLLHYPIAICWAFLFGLTYSMYWNQVPHDWYDRDSVGLTTPLHFGLFSAGVMAVVGIGTTAMYACLAYGIYSWRRASL